MNNLTLGLAVIAGCTLGAIGGIVSNPEMRLNPDADWRSRLPSASVTQPQLTVAELSYPGPRWWVYGNKRYTAEDRWYGQAPQTIRAELPDVGSEPAFEQEAANDVPLEPTVRADPVDEVRYDAQRAVAAAIAATAGMVANHLDDQDWAESSADEDQPEGL